MTTEFDIIETPLEREMAEAEARIRDLEGRLTAETAARDEAEKLAASAVLADDRGAAQIHQRRAKEIGKACDELNRSLNRARKDLAAMKKAAEKAMKEARKAAREENEEEAIPPNLPIEGVRWTKTGRPQVQLKINGAWYTFPTAAITKPAVFRERWLELTGTFPSLPTGKRAREVWEKYVEGLYAQAEVYVPPPDATPEGLLREEVQRALRSLPFGSMREDLDARRALRLEGDVLFKMTALLPLISDPSPDLLKLYDALRELKVESHSRRVDGEVVRVWIMRDPGAASAAPMPTAPTAPTASAAESEAPAPVEPAAPAAPRDNTDFEVA